MNITTNYQVLNAIQRQPKRTPVAHRNSLDTISFGNNLENLKEKVETLKAELLKAEPPTPETQKAAEMFSKIKENTLWGDYRNITFKTRSALPNDCFISLSENICSMLTRKDTFFEKTILKFFEKRNEAGDINKLDRLAESIINKLGIENKKAYVLQLCHIIKSEATDEQKQFFKAVFDLNKEHFEKSTESKILKQLYNKFI